MNRGYVPNFNTDETIEDYQRESIVISMDSIMNEKRNINIEIEELRDFNKNYKNKNKEYLKFVKQENEDKIRELMFKEINLTNEYFELIKMLEDYDNLK